MHPMKSSLRIPLAGAGALALSLLASSASAQVSISSIALVGVGNTQGGPGVDVLSSDSHDDTSISNAVLNKSFTGMNRNGDSQTMNFQGQTTVRSNYGRLHAYTSGAVTNS